MTGIRVYAGAWLVLVVASFLIPAEGKMSDRAGFWAIVVLGYYVVLSIATATMVVAFSPRPRSPITSSDADEYWSKVALISLAIAILGMCTLMYDRLVIQDIDYSKGLAAARNAWTQRGAERNGISSLYSAFGNVASHFAFVTVVGILIAWESFRAARAWAILSISAGACVLFAVLNGGRSHFLLLVSVVLAAGALRRQWLKRRFLPWQARRAFLLVSIGMLLFLSYAVYVVGARASLGQFSPEHYSEVSIDFLGGKVTPSYSALGRLPGSLSDVAYLSVTVMGYITHGVWSTEQILTTQARPGMVMFAQPRVILMKLGLLDTFGEYLLYGKFLPVPGAVFYDYGWTGVVIAAILHGVGLGLVGRRPSRGSHSSLRLGIATGILVISVWSPIVFAVDTYGFPFMIAAFVMTDILMRGAGLYRWLVSSWRTTGQRELR